MSPAVDGGRSLGNDLLFRSARAWATPCYIAYHDAGPTDAGLELFSRADSEEVLDDGAEATDLVSEDLGFALEDFNELVVRVAHNAGGVK